MRCTGQGLLPALRAFCCCYFCQFRTKAPTRTTSIMRCRSSVLFQGMPRTRMLRRCMSLTYSGSCGGNEGHSCQCIQYVHTAGGTRMGRSRGPAGAAAGRGLWLWHQTCVAGTRVGSARGPAGAAAGRGLAQGWLPMCMWLVPACSDVSSMFTGWQGLRPLLRVAGTPTRRCQGTRRTKAIRHPCAANVRS